MSIYVFVSKVFDTEFLICWWVFVKKFQHVYLLHIHYFNVDHIEKIWSILICIYPIILCLIHLALKLIFNMRRAAQCFWDSWNTMGGCISKPNKRIKSKAKYIYRPFKLGRKIAPSSTIAPVENPVYEEASVGEIAVHLHGEPTVSRSSEVHLSHNQVGANSRVPLLS